MEMAFNLKDVAYLISQAVIVSAVIVTNRQNITHLKDQLITLQTELESLQDELKGLRIKLGK